MIMHEVVNLQSNNFNLIKIGMIEVWVQNVELALCYPSGTLNLEVAFSFCKIFKPFDYARILQCVDR
jgi:hypothetical protein